MSDATPAPPHVGLCPTCQQVKAIVSGKGSHFWYCLRSESDERYAKYPRLPVLQCPGYEPHPTTPLAE